jgi:hypothetical protein
MHKTDILVLAAQRIQPDVVVEPSGVGGVFDGVFLFEFHVFLVSFVRAMYTCR